MNEKTKKVGSMNKTYHSGVRFIFPFWIPFRREKRSIKLRINPEFFDKLSDFLKNDITK